MIPVLDYVYAKVVEEDTGVYTNTNITDSKQKYEVLAVGPGRYEHGKLTTPEVEAGDVVYIQKHADQDTPQTMIDKGYALFMASRIMAKEEK